MRLGLSFGKEQIKLAKELGAGGVSMGVQALVQEGPEKTLAPLRENGLSVCHWTHWWYNPLVQDADKLAQATDTVKRAIPVVADTGCPDIVVNGGNYHPSGFEMSDPRNFTDQAIDEVARVMGPLLKLAEKHGAFLCVEPYIHCVVCTPERFLKLKEKVGSDALMCTLDICNFYTYPTMFTPTEHVRHVCETLKGHYRCVHAKDMIVSPGFHIHIDEADFLGQGSTDWITALQLIDRDMAGDGFVILEHHKTADTVRKGMANLKKAAEQAGVTLG